jgi:hypothetical protein
MKLLAAVVSNILRELPFCPAPSKVAFDYEASNKWCK